MKLVLFEQLVKGALNEKEEASRRASIHINLSHIHEKVGEPLVLFTGLLD